jgi:hypothetical protein
MDIIKPHVPLPLHPFPPHRLARRPLLPKLTPQLVRVTVRTAEAAPAWGDAGVEVMVAARASGGAAEGGPGGRGTGGMAWTGRLSGRGVDPGGGTAGTGLGGAGGGGAARCVGGMGRDSLVVLVSG